ncbi:hypothetical protein [Haloferax sp. DFSO60]|uniref:hypothetical protein n=1 Tax=Haloferax sp. DFSO60 TaxID=3388652 RepID=UPI00397C3F8A
MAQSGQSDESRAPPGHEVGFSLPSEGEGLIVRDRIERHQVRIRTQTAITPEPTDETRFWFPTDAAVRIETTGFEVTGLKGIIVRDLFGEMVTQVDRETDITLDSGSYSLELFTSMKVYIQISSSLRIKADSHRTRIELPERTPIHVGARSYHRSPATTITTTEDPRDVMKAVSAFGSALKTTSVERSYPTLRGHPPLLEVGDELDIPDGVEPPNTGLRIVVPPELQYIVVVAPLVYYLGATLGSGAQPRIESETGFVHLLDGPHGFEAEVERVLKQTFFFDCVTRTEGYYRVDLHEREAVEERTNLDFTQLYDAEPGERLKEYLSVPFDVVSELMPEWKLTTHVEAQRDNLSLLPFIVNDLAVVKTPNTERIGADELQASAVDDFLRDEETFTRSAASSPPSTDTYIKPQNAESADQAWVGDGAPVGASKPTQQAYENRLARTAKNGTISIAVVCNDLEMSAEEDLVDTIYGSRDELPFEVSYHKGLSMSELRAVLEEQNDFLHFIGHIDGEGLQCTDGRLDAHSVGEIGAESFLLNGCRSYDQGLAFIDAGAIGGIVTLSDVINKGAVEVGGVLAQLLNMGFPLQTALNVSQRNSTTSQQYTIVGDGALSISQTESGMAIICEVEQTQEAYTLTFKTYPTIESSMGALVKPAVSKNGQHYLVSSDEAVFEVSKAELREFLTLEQVPVFYRGRLFWNDEFLES